MRSILVIGILFFSFVSQADTVPQYGFSDEENQHMSEQNAQMAIFEIENPTLFASSDPLSFNLLETTEATAFAEYEDTGYLIFSSNYSFKSRKAKMTMAKHLPEAVQLVVFTDSSANGEAGRIKKEFSNSIDPNRITVVYMPRASRGFWARDGVPVPVFRTPKIKNGVELFALVDARYSRFEQDKRFGQLFDAELTKYDYYFEGGNFIANSQNHCLVVNKSATAKIPDSTFQKHYGCKVLTRLPYVKGIGHADESVKFIDDDTVLTDEKSYVKTLKERGYEVILLPRPLRQYETYVNSLMINGVVYVPIFNEKGDDKALQVYRDAGFEKVIGINTETLSNDGLGSLHCITMTYPPVEMNELLNSLGGVVLQ